MTIQLPEHTITTIIARLETISRYTDHHDITPALEQLIDAHLYGIHHGQDN